MWLVEPLTAGLCVALINKFIINNTRLCSFCSPTNIDSDTGSEIRAIDTSLHFHSHYIYIA